MLNVPIKISTTVLTVILFAGSVLSQTAPIRDLNGFRLGQIRAAVHMELGEPDDDGKTGELFHEVYFLSDTTYIVFQYHSTEPQIIYSIQVTGPQYSGDLGFAGLRLGSDAKAVEKALGIPYKKIDIGERGARWEYESANFSVEVNGGKLASIRISDLRKEDNDPDIEKVLKFTEVRKTLLTGSNKQIADILAPGLEVYENEKILYFQYPLRKEIDSDASGVFAALRKLAKGLETVDPNDPEVYEENGRFSYGRDMMHVIKLKKMASVKEIVFRWDGQNWGIWEIGTGKAPFEPGFNYARYKPGTLRGLESVQMPALLKDPDVVLYDNKKTPIVQLSYNSYPTQARVVYTGVSRETSPARLVTIQHWLTTFGRKESPGIFASEYKFTEGGIDYWLPVQMPVATHFPAEVKKGDEIFIYVAWVGVSHGNGKPESVAVVNEFSIIEENN